MIINDALRSLNRFKDFDPVTSRVVIVTRRPGPKSDTLIRFSCTVLTTVSEMTYTVSSGTLNSSIPYRRNGGAENDGHEIAGHEIARHDTLVNMGTGCPICRADIQMVMRVYN